jgi:ABC-type lipopolysaccharide export system ATPase subunit
MAASAENSSREKIVAAVVVVLLLVFFPWLNPGYRYLSLAITTGITAIALYGLGLQFGQAGIMSVGHAAFIGVGAYTAAILSGKLGAGFWVALPFSMLLSALIAGLVGLPSLRVSGQHYIIITFCFCALLNIALTNGGDFTGGATGLDVGSIDRIFDINFDQLRNAYYLVILALFIFLVVIYLITNSSYGRALFNVVAGVHKPTAGRVTWQGKDITGKSAYQIARAGLVRTFQQAMSYPGLSVRENVRIACEHGRRREDGSKQKWSSPEEILHFVGLGGLDDALAGSMPFGNLRRLGVAVALGANPILLLLDEPAAGLNDSETSELSQLILQLPKLGTGICLIDHDMYLMGTL